MDDDRPRLLSSPIRVGDDLDRLSVEDLDARISELRNEIVRVEAARDIKRRHLEQVGSIFSPVPERDC